MADEVQDFLLEVLADDSVELQNKERQAELEREAAEREASKRFKEQQQVAEYQEKEAQRKEAKRLERARFMARDLSLDDMFRQSCARAYFIKTKGKEHLDPRSRDWTEIPKAAVRLQSRFQQAKNRLPLAEAQFRASQVMGDVNLMKKYKAEADEVLKTCLHSHYAIGVMYSEFLDRGFNYGKD